MQLFRILIAVLLVWAMGHGIAIGQQQKSYGERIPFTRSVPVSAMYPGVVVVKISESTEAGFSSIRTGSGSWNTGNKALDVTFNKLGITAIDSFFAPVLANAEANEFGNAITQMKAAGLFRWYRMHFPNGQDLFKMCEVLKSIPGIEAAEPVGRIMTSDVPNDAQFTNQWSLQNTGQTGGRIGADISAVPAWDIETGKPETILAVHDGGVQLNHPDLQQNLWVEKAFNFVNNSPNLTYDAHGTHVAGLLGAVRNNANGVAGIAGGNGSANSGIRMMSLQIVGGTPVQAGHEALSFVYAANNGAAISQNSWSYASPNFFPSYAADAIDFFIANGGGSVIKGGIVIFSAGNANTEQTYFPGAYSRVLSVGSTNHNDVKASYSNYGSWVDISAPGGDGAAPMLSTVTNSTYGNLFGTSMACPLVSGAAALLVSHVPGRLLADDVRSMLLYGVDDIYPINSVNYAGKLGSGRLNVFKALKRADSVLSSPQMPEVNSFSVNIACSTLQLSWTIPSPATRVIVAMAPANQAMGMPFGKVYQTGDTLEFGGKIVYAGSNSSIELPMPIDGSNWQWRIWSTNATGTGYSTGVSRVMSVPVTINNMAAVGSATSIQIGWQRQCPLRQVMLAYSADGRFGMPSGNPSGVSSINGGGTVLQIGNQTGFVHSDLPADATLYYAAYPYFFDGVNWKYGEPVKIVANTLCSKQLLPIKESFTNTIFPSPGWKITDGGQAGSLTPDGRTWRRLQLVGSQPNDDISALINAYTQNGSNSKEVLRMPAFLLPADTDSVVIDFDYAYRAYSNEPELADSLELAWTDNCGATYQTIWKKGGVDLATVAGVSTAEFVPAGPQDWKNMRFHLGGLVPADRDVALAFIGTNKFGQNIWLDNVNLQAFERKKADVSISAASPLADTLVCSVNFLPTIRLANVGPDTVRTVQIKWLIDGVLSDSVDFANLQIPPAKDTVLALKNLTLTAGLQAYTFISDKPNNFLDGHPQNDTLRLGIAVAGSGNLPLAEGFESSAPLPTGWVNTQLAGQWKNTIVASYSGSQSVFSDRFSDNNQVGKIELVTPQLAGVANADSVFLHFSIAAAMRNTASIVTSDTFEIWISNDCGRTLQRVYRKAGQELATIGTPLTTPFVPNDRSEWRRELLDFTEFRQLFTNTSQIIFRIIRGRGNQVYLDDVNLFTKTIPPALKAAEFGVYPNPFNNSFTVWHLRPVPGLRSARLVNTAGQLVQQWTWNGNAPQTLRVNTFNLARGMYILQLQYDSFTKTVKLLKL